MIRKLYAWTLALAGHPQALWALAIIAFLESSVFPIPPDILMIPMILVQPKRAFFIASIALTASVAGGLLGYFIGASLYDEVGQPVLSFLGITEIAEELSKRFARTIFANFLITSLY